jgi:hypothetical protein
MVSKMKAAEDRATFHDYESPVITMEVKEPTKVKAKTKTTVKAKAKSKSKPSEVIQVPTTMKKVTRRPQAQ